MSCCPRNIKQNSLRRSADKWLWICPRRVPQASGNDEAAFPTRKCHVGPAQATGFPSLCLMRIVSVLPLAGDGIYLELKRGPAAKTRSVRPRAATVRKRPGIHECAVPNIEPRLPVVAAHAQRRRRFAAQVGDGQGTVRSVEAREALVLAPLQQHILYGSCSIHRFDGVEWGWLRPPHELTRPFGSGKKDPTYSTSSIACFRAHKL